MARKPFRAVPLRVARDPPPRRRRARRVTPIMVVLPMAVLTAAFVWRPPSPRPTAHAPDPAQVAQRRWTTPEELDRQQPSLARTERETTGLTGDSAVARFALCSGPVRVTCVVDGDTFWFRGEKIRIADINAPEVSHPGCAREAALGKAATGRLLLLLNQGPFSLAPDAADPGRDHDRYGRLLRTITRGGGSVGEELVREGLAEKWKGYRGDWCQP